MAQSERGNAKASLHLNSPMGAYPVNHRKMVNGVAHQELQFPSKCRFMPGMISSPAVHFNFHGGRHIQHFCGLQSVPNLHDLFPGTISRALQLFLTHAMIVIDERLGKAL